MTELNETSSRLEENKALIRRVEEAWQADDWDTLDDLFAPGMVSHSAVPYLPAGLSGWKVAHQQMRRAGPDRKVTIEDIIAEGDRVVVRCRMVGTNSGGLPWAEVSPNDHAIDMEWISIYRI